MQEILFIQQHFISLLAGETAKNIFNTRTYFQTIDDLTYDISLSQEVLNYCQEYGAFTFLEISDVRNNIKFSEKDYVLDKQHIYAVCQSLKQWHALSKLELIPQQYPNLYQFIHEIFAPIHLLSHWKNAFDLEGNIADSASPELRRIRTLKKNLRKQIEKILNSQLQKNEDLAEKRIAFREDRYVLPIKSTAKNRTEGIVHGFSNSGLITYIEPPQIIALNNELLSVDDLEQQEIYRLLRQWSKIIAENSDDIILIINRSAELEIFFVKNLFAKKYSSKLGSINTDKQIILKNVYNPFLLIKKGKDLVVPITIELENNNFGIIISGPNAGGKSAALKTLALCVDMFLKGLPIPAEDISLPLFSDILIEIGDSQNLDNDLSTFSGHLYSIKHILDSCSPTTLVLIDEIAHATDPVEGEALACAIIDELIAQQSFFAITTHYKQVKIKSFEHQHIKSYATGFDTKTLTPQYILYPNTIGESYALNIASRIGLSDHIIKEAENNLTKQKDKTEIILSNIEEFEKKLRQKEQELDHILQQTHKEKLSLQQQQQQLNKESIALKKEGLVQADRELSYCLRELSNIQKTLAKNPQESAKKLKEIQETINKKKSDITNLICLKKTHIAVGESVYVASLNKDATIESIQKNSLTVRTGMIKISVKKSDIFEPKIQKNSNNTKITKKYYTTAISNSVDVHGLTVDEALSKIDKYLYSAMTSGLYEFTIIHGKGTGILQKAVHHHLKTIPEVKKFNFAPPQEGGSGKTILYFNE